ncbi:unnamed protein product [Alopecurus aequalis]
MTVVDFIEVIDDIIDLSSDEETVQQDHNATQPQVMLLDEQVVFVLAGEKTQNEQAEFVSAGEGSQEATGSENALVATVSPLVVEKVSLDTAEPKMSPTSAPLPGPTSTTPKAVTSEVRDTQLLATASPPIMEKAPLCTAELKNCPSSPASPLPSPASTTPKVQSSKVGDTKLMRVYVRHPKYHTSTPRRSPRFVGNSPVEELGVYHKRSRMLEPAEESACAADNGASTKTLSIDSAN